MSPIPRPSNAITPADDLATSGATMSTKQKRSARGMSPAHLNADPGDHPLNLTTASITYFSWPLK